MNDLDKIFSEVLKDEDLNNLKLEEERAEVLEDDYYLDTIHGKMLICGNCKTFKERYVLGVIRPVACDCELIQKVNEFRETDPEFQKEKEIILERQKKYSMLGGKFKYYTLENDDKENKAISRTVNEYTRQFDKMLKENKGILFYGDVGTGKTFYALAIANELLERGRFAYVTTISKLISELQSVTFDKIETQKIYDRIKNCQLLVIDDLATESNSEFRQEMTYNIINTRYLSGKPLIVTTNLSLDYMQNSQNMNQQRIFDRILEMTTPLKISGKSKRQEPTRSKQDELLKSLGLKQ